MICEIRFNNDAKRKILNVVSAFQYQLKYGTGGNDTFIYVYNKKTHKGKEIKYNSKNIKSITVREPWA